VIPAWQTGQVRPEPGELAIVLDPGMAFGTGLHPSTQLCLRAMEEVVGPGQRVLDAGCGSGILSIAAAGLGAASVDAFDIDPLAVDSTAANAALNDLQVPINVFGAAGPDDSPFWATGDGSRPAWDTILVNILPHVIVELLRRGLHTYLAPGGRMILAGIIEEREPDLRSALAERNLTVVNLLTEDDWLALVVA